MFHMHLSEWPKKRKVDGNVQDRMELPEENAHMAKHIESTYEQSCQSDHMANCILESTSF